MINAQQKSDAAHQKLMNLLPWYVNKSLKGQELITLEKHLSVCLVCKRELTQLEKLAQAVVADTSFDSAEKASFARLKNRLHGNPSALPAATSPIQPAQAQKFGAQHRTGKARISFSRPLWAVAATLLLALMLPLHITKDNPAPVVAVFKTLSSKQSGELNANEIRVVFADKTDDRKKNLILQRINGQIVDKPTEQNVYTIRLQKAMEAKQLIDVVKSLRKDNDIIFAEPAYTFLSSLHNQGKK